MFIIDILKETAKLFLEMAPYLMIGLIFVGILNLIFNKDLIVKHIGKNNFWSVLKAALFGVPLPLCSCGVVPSAVYMKKNGASNGSVVAFLISTPQTGIDSMIATYGMMGWVFAIYRPFAALIMGVIGGSIVRFLNTEDNKYKSLSIKEYQSDIENYSKDSCCDDDDCDDEKHTNKINSTFKESKLKRFFQYSSVEFLDDISVQFVIGLFISGLIAYLIPEGFFEKSSFNNGIAGMLLMILIGAPMYVCATASIPIAITLMMKGFSPGVAYVFLVAGPATNAASFTILMKVLGKKTTFLYITTISIMAIVFGLLLDKIFLYLKIDPVAHLMHIHEHQGYFTELIQWIIGGVFLILLVWSLYRKLIKSKIKSKEKKMDQQTIKIEGMSCNHCVMNVKKAILQVEGVTDVDVNLSQAEAYVKGEFDLNKIENAVNDIGYSIGKN